MRPLSQLCTATVIAATLTAFVACGPKPAGNDPSNPGSPTSNAKAVPKQGALVKGKASKGGSGKENGAGGQTSDKTMGAATAAGNKDSTDNDCAGVPDGDAICKSAQISICQGEQEYFLDCNQYAKNEGWQSGDCFEHEKITDCMGCETHADGTSACCDVEMKSICCNDAGECWAP